MMCRCNFYCVPFLYEIIFLCSSFIRFRDNTGPIMDNIISFLIKMLHLCRISFTLCSRFFLSHVSGNVGLVFTVNHVCSHSYLYLLFNYYFDNQISDEWKIITTPTLYIYIYIWKLPRIKHDYLRRSIYKRFDLQLPSYIADVSEILMELRLQFNRCILSICDNRTNQKLHYSFYLVSANDIYKITLRIKQRSNNTIV